MDKGYGLVFICRSQYHTILLRDFHFWINMQARSLHSWGINSQQIFEKSQLRAEFITKSMSFIHYKTKITRSWQTWRHHILHYDTIHSLPYLNHAWSISSELQEKYFFSNHLNKIWQWVSWVSNIWHLVKKKSLFKKMQ